MDTALRHHRAAQQTRRGSVTVEEDPENYATGQREYGLAVQAYREFLRRHPACPIHYEIRFSLADALYWSGHYADALTEFQAVRDDSTNADHLAEAARMVVESQQRLVDIEVRAARVALRQLAPAPMGSPRVVHAVPIPQELRGLLEARAEYLARVPVDRDRERLRGAYAFNNAMVLYLYGHWPESRRAVRQLLSGHATDDAVAADALQLIVSMAIALDDSSAVDGLRREFENRCAAWIESQPATSSRECAFSGHLGDLGCAPAGHCFAAMLVRSNGAIPDWTDPDNRDDWRPLFVDDLAARMLIARAESATAPADRIVPLYWAGLAFMRARRFLSAMTVFRMLVEALNDPTTRTAANTLRDDEILAAAHLRAGDCAIEVGDIDAALASYDALASVPQRDRTPPQHGYQALLRLVHLLDSMGADPSVVRVYQRVMRSLSSVAHDGVERWRATRSRRSRALLPGLGHRPLPPSLDSLE